MPRDSSSSTSRSRRIAKRSLLPKLARRAPTVARRISMRLAERAEGTPEDLPVASEGDDSVEDAEDHSREHRIGHARARASLASTYASVSSAKLKVSRSFLGACI